MPLSAGGRARPRWYLELPLLVGGYLAFGVTRAAVDRGDPAATTDATTVQRVEQTLHLAVESVVNGIALDHRALMYATGYWYRLCLLAVPVTLVLLYAWWPAAYRRWRSALVLLTLLDLPLVWLFPASPPRFAQPGIVDYIARLDILGGAAAALPRSGANLLAAMPSMHVAWTTWCALALWSVLRQGHPGAAWLVWLLPVGTALVVVATGNHYLLDVVAGVALVAVSSALMHRLSR